MDIDLTPFFTRYEEIAIMADNVFERIKKEFPDCVQCKTGCSDCCYALFDLSLIESAYINYNFLKRFTGEERDVYLENANKIDRQLFKIKRQAYIDSKNGMNMMEILEKLSIEKIRCPLLNDYDKCDLYEFRPITCRLYGIPTAISGKGSTCPLSNFQKGQQYPTVQIDIIRKQLYQISIDVIKSLNSKYQKIAEMLVPLSMALLTNYNEEYFGIENEK